MEANPMPAEQDVRAFILAYEKALADGDLAAQDRMCWDSESAVAFGIGGEFYGARALSDYRKRRVPRQVVREVTRLTVLATSDTVAVAALLLQLPTGRTCRQTFVCERRGDGWVIVHTHASLSAAEATDR